MREADELGETARFIGNSNLNSEEIRLEFQIKRAVSRSSSTSRTYEAWSSRATYLCARNGGSSFSVSRENVQPNKECLAEHSALSLTILRKAWLSPQPRGEVSPRTDDVSGLRDFRIPRVTCCPSHCLTLIKLLIADLSRRQYRRSSSISLQSHTYRGSIVLRLIDSYSLYVKSLTVISAWVTKSSRKKHWLLW